MFDFLRNIFHGKAGDVQPDSESAISVETSQPTAPPQAPAPSAAPIPQRPYVTDDDDGVEVSLQAVLGAFPMELKGRIRQSDVGEATVSIPLNKVLAQLASGSVKITFGELRRAAPQLFSPGSDCDQIQVPLPLNEILVQVNPTMLARRPNQRRIEIPEDIRSPFGENGNGLIFSIGPNKLEPSAAATRATTPAAPARTEMPAPPPRSMTPVASPKSEAPAAPARAITPAPPARAPSPEPPVRAVPPVAPVRPAAPAAPPRADAPPAPARTAPSAAPVAQPRPAAPAPLQPVRPPVAPVAPASQSPVRTPPIPTQPQAVPVAKTATPSPTAVPPPPIRMPTAPIAPGTLITPIAPAAPITPIAPAAAPRPTLAPRDPLTAAPKGTQTTLAARAAATAVPAPQSPFPGGTGPSLSLPLMSLVEAWPEALRHELVQQNLLEVQLVLPVEAVEQSLKRGKIAYPWKVLRACLRPQTAPTASAHDNVVVELPLKVVAPLFLNRQKEAGKAQHKVAIDENIPNLFFGFPQPGQPGAAPAPGDTAAAVAAAPPAPAAKPADTNYFSWDDGTNAASSTDTQFKRKPSGLPGTNFVTRCATPNEVVSRAAALDGVAGALIALPDGLMVASRLSSDLNGDTLAAFLPQIFSKVSACTKELRMGELNNLNFTVGNVPWKIFRVNAIFFAAFGRPGQPLPTSQLVALAAELDRKKQ